MAESVPKTLEEVRKAGYQEVETAGFFDLSAAEFKKILDDNGLRATGMHVGATSQLMGPINESIENAMTLGASYIVCPWIMAEERGSLDEYRLHAERMNQAGRLIKQAGLQFAYHNHDFEFERFGDTVAYDLLLEETDPDLVQMELDLFWIVKAGYDPVEYFINYPGRFPLCHLKDRTADGDMVAVGDGAIDFETILNSRFQAGLRHYYTEHDNPDDPVAWMRASAKHMRSLGWG